MPSASLASLSSSRAGLAVPDLYAGATGFVSTAMLGLAKELIPGRIRVNSGQYMP